MAGWTTSADFPTVSPYQGARAGGVDAFVRKLTAAGDALSYSTYLGGSGNDYTTAMTIDSSGCVYVTDISLLLIFLLLIHFREPIRPERCFVTKFTADGTALSYSTYLGGSSDDEGYGITVDSSGCTYVAGYTKSTNFPTANAFQGTKGTYNDAFAAKFTASGNTLSYPPFWEETTMIPVMELQLIMPDARM